MSDEERRLKGGYFQTASSPGVLLIGFWMIADFGGSCRASADCPRRCGASSKSRSPPNTLSSRFLLRRVFWSAGFSPEIKVLALRSIPAKNSKTLSKDVLNKITKPTMLVLKSNTKAPGIVINIETPSQADLPKLPARVKVAIERKNKRIPMITLGCPKAIESLDVKKPSEIKINGRKIVVQPKYPTRASLILTKILPWRAKDTKTRAAAANNPIWKIEITVSRFNFNPPCAFFVSLFLEPFFRPRFFFLAIIHYTNKYQQE